MADQPQQPANQNPANNDQPDQVPNQHEPWIVNQGDPVNEPPAGEEELK